MYALEIGLREALTDNQEIEECSVQGRLVRGIGINALGRRNQVEVLGARRSSLVKERAEAEGESSDVASGGLEVKVDAIDNGGSKRTVHGARGVDGPEHVPDELRGALGLCCGAPSALGVGGTAEGEDDCLAEFFLAGDDVLSGQG